MNDSSFFKEIRITNNKLLPWYLSTLLRVERHSLIRQEKKESLSTMGGPTGTLIRRTLEKESLKNQNHLKPLLGPLNEETATIDRTVSLSINSLEDRKDYIIHSFRFIYTHTTTAYPYSCCNPTHDPPVHTRPLVRHSKNCPDPNLWQSDLASVPSSYYTFWPNYPEYA